MKAERSIKRAIAKGRRRWGKPNGVIPGWWWDKVEIFMARSKHRPGRAIAKLRRE
jgi:hypothetical protein